MVKALPVDRDLVHLRAVSLCTAAQTQAYMKQLWSKKLPVDRAFFASLHKRAGALGAGAALDRRGQTRNNYGQNTSGGP